MAKLNESTFCRAENDQSARGRNEQKPWQKPNQSKPRESQNILKQTEDFLFSKCLFF